VKKVFPVFISLAAFALALTLVIGCSMFSAESKLKASDENVYEDYYAEASRANEVQEYSIELSEEAPAERSVIIICNVGMANSVEIGDTVYLTAKLYGYEGAQVECRWTYLDTETNEWVPISGATGTEYCFTASEETLARSYNVQVNVVG